MTDSPRAMNPVGWFEIYVQNMDRAKAFYETVLKHKLEKLMGDTGDAPDMSMWSFPMNPDGKGITGALVQMKGVASGGNSTLVYFSCQDCAVEAARVAAAGGRIEREKISIGEYGFIALAVDTEGNTFGLHSLK
jgi:uncharacterized protein